MKIRHKMCVFFHACGPLSQACRPERCHDVQIHASAACDRCSLCSSCVRLLWLPRRSFGATYRFSHAFAPRKDKLAQIWHHVVDNNHVFHLVPSSGSDERERSFLCAGMLATRALKLCREAYSGFTSRNLFKLIPFFSSMLNHQPNQCAVFHVFLKLKGFWHV